MRGRVFFFSQEAGLGTGEEIICSAGEKGNGKWARGGKISPSELRQHSR